MEIKHTPGPWGVTDDTPIIIFGEDGCGLAHVIGKTFGPEEVEKAKANARLIAAAPELLDILQLLCFAIERNIDCTPKQVKDLLIEAYAAITKATDTVPAETVGIEPASTQTPELEALKLERDYLLSALNVIAVTAENGLNDSPDKIDLVDIRDTARAAIGRATVPSNTPTDDLKTGPSQPSLLQLYASCLVEYDGEMCEAVVTAINREAQTFDVVFDRPDIYSTEPMKNIPFGKFRLQKSGF